MLHQCISVGAPGRLGGPLGETPCFFTLWGMTRASNDTYSVDKKNMRYTLW